MTTSDGQRYEPGVDKSSVKAFYQSLSIRNGVVHTNVTWAPRGEEGAHYQLNFTVFAHRKRVNVGVVRLDLAASEDVKVNVTDVLDGTGAVRANFADKAVEDDNTIWTSVKPWGIGNVTAYVLSSVDMDSNDHAELHRAQQSRTDATDSPWLSKNQSTVAQSWELRLKPGTSVTIYKYVGIASSDAFPREEYSTAKNAAIEAKRLQWHALLEEHVQAWEESWHAADIVIPGDKQLQTSARATLFHILTNLRPGTEGAGLSDNSISVAGLASESYAGLIFWDADTWIYPSLLSLQPEYAMTINNYRTRLLGQAARNAQSYGYAGVLFPWTSGRFGNCTGTGLCKDYQYHLNTDIALAHWQYFLHTRDVGWLAEKGWPILKSVADMFAAYVVRNERSGKYETLLLGEPVGKHHTLSNSFA